MVSKSAHVRNDLPIASGMPLAVTHSETRADRVNSRGETLEILRCRRTGATISCFALNHADRFVDHVRSPER